MEFNAKKKIDLAGVSCPMNFVKTKAALADMEKGELLEIILDEGDAIVNVPRSLKEEGHRVIKAEPMGAHFKVMVRKG